ncbi:MAG: hypothetical protein JXR84_26225 [Anaerolineae bacterium]|nr:hypothetical protein [Anaerolineae bacterium]
MNAKVKRWTTGMATLVVLFTVALIMLAMSPSWGNASPLAPTAAEDEPNDSFAAADTFVIPGNMTGAITSTVDVDYFKITTTSTQLYTVTLTPSGVQVRRIDVYTNAYAWVASAQTDPSQAPVSLSFQAQTTLYYIRVTAPNNDPTGGLTDYTIIVSEPTVPPPDTATPMPTPMPPPANIPGESEPNDTVGTADPFTVPGRIYGAIPNIYDVDCFAANTILGLQYRLILTDYGLTRWLKVYDNNGYYIMGNTTSSNHEVELTLQTNTPAPYYLCVSAVTTASPSNTNVDYLLEVIILQPTPTPTDTRTPTPTNTPTPSTATVTPKPTWPSGYDTYEPNYNFALATTIASGLTYNCNFVPWGGATADNDYFKIRVKPGLQLTCATSNLDPGVDPRMAFYSGPAESYFIMANDDIALGDFNSRLSLYTSFEGFIYILVGQGDRMAVRDAAQSDYTLNCDLTVPGAQTTATPSPSKGDATPPPATTPVATATPKTPVSPVATPTPPAEASGENRELDFRLVTTPVPPTSTPAPTGFRTFRVIVYYDANNDGLSGAGEGVPGFFVTVNSPETKAELARGYTDDQGQISFTVSTVGTVRVLIPLLGFDRLVEAAKPEVSVRIAPPALPVTIP